MRAWLCNAHRIDLQSVRLLLDAGIEEKLALYGLSRCEESWSQDCKTAKGRNNDSLEMQ